MTDFNKTRSWERVSFFTIAHNLKPIAPIMPDDNLHKLQERVKELTLLHSAARLLQDDEKPPLEIIREIVHRIPPAWQYPEITSARISFRDINVATENFRKSYWSQRSEFLSKNDALGYIEVCYLQEMPASFEGPFLKEERDLIDSLAEMLRVYFRHKQDDDALKAARENLEIQVHERTSELAKANLALKKEVEEHLQARLKIEQYQKQLQDLTSKLTLTEENERREIASDLHDHIGQALAFIKIKVQEFQGNSIFSGQNESIERIITLLDQTIKYTRSLTFEISQPLLYELGLQPALEWLADSYQKKYKIRIKLKNSADFSILTLDLQVLLYKSVRELLTNIIKHASASNVVIDMRASIDFLEIAVKDNGKGFDTNILNSIVDDRKGFGLFSISERLRYFSGEMTIDSKISKGTTVFLRIPELDSKN